MRTTRILLLGSRESRPLLERLLGLGLEPLLREGILSTLSTLRRGSFAVIAVDPEHLAIDLLEFVLNVRDIDGRIPIAILGEPPDARIRDTLASQPGVHVLPAEETATTFADHLLHIMSCPAGDASGA